MKTNGSLQLHPCLRIALCLVVGIFAGKIFFYLIPQAYWLASLFCVLLMAISTGKRPLLQTTFIFISTFIFGGLLFTIHYSKVCNGLKSDYIVFEGVLNSQPQKQGKVIRFDMIVTKINDAVNAKDLNLLHSGPINVKAILLCDTIENRYKQLKLGDGIVACSRFEVPQNYSRGKFDYRQWMISHGFVAQSFIYKDNWQKQSIDISSLSLFARTKIAASVFRQNLLANIPSHTLKKDDYGVLAAMALGDKSALTREVKEIYSITGASHVLALSGLHLGIIYSILTFFSFGLGRNWVMQIIIILSIWSYAFLVGLAPSVVRTAIMLSLYAFVTIANNDKASLNTLSVAAMVMLIVNPLNLFDIGFQMSFMAVLSILVFFPILYGIVDKKYLSSHRFLNWIWSLTSVSLAAQIGTMPLVIYYFGRFPSYFLLTNFLVIPAATIILYLSFAFLLFFYFPFVQKMVFFCLEQVLCALNGTLSWMSKLPFSSIDNITISLSQLLAFYALIACIYGIIRYLRLMIEFSKQR